MEPLGRTPFEHALALAWTDGVMTAMEFRHLDTLQQALGISDQERSLIEENYENKLVEGTAKVGTDRDSLAKWIDAIRALTAVHPDISSGLARRLGGTALRAGLTQAGWKLGYTWMDQLGLAKPFAEGCWMVGGPLPPLNAVPLALAPVANSLSLLEQW